MKISTGTTFISTVRNDISHFEVNDITVVQCPIMDEWSVEVTFRKRFAEALDNGIIELT